jgi:outer membrane protein
MARDPTRRPLDPTLTGTIQLQRSESPAESIFSRALRPTRTVQLRVQPGIRDGTRHCRWASTINGSRPTTSSTITARCIFPASRPGDAAPAAGRGIWVNKRFMYQALNDRRITDSSFRQQILYTVNQVETIYWGLVQAYEDVQAKERALDQSNQLLSDNKKQLEIGTMAPLDVVNAESSGNADQQALISAQSASELPAADHQAGDHAQPQRCRALSCSGDSDGPREPGGDSEESQPVEALVQEAFQQRPELEAGGADAAQRRDHAEGRAQCAAADAGRRTDSTARAQPAARRARIATTFSAIHRRHAPRTRIRR